MASRDAATVVDLDWTQRIPGCSENSSETSKSLQDTLLHAIGAAPAGPLTAAIDSLDTLAEDLGSHASAARLVQSVITLLETRPAGSRLILPLLAPSSIAPHLSAFRPRTELILHAPHLLRHLAKDYSTPPSNMRIWTLLPQLAARREGERLVDGSPNVHGVAVVEVIKPERKGVARVLEVWADGQAYRIDRLGLGAALPEAQPVQPQPDAGLSFKLSMTPDEQAARSQVALPYAHTGQQSAGEIIYDPDSADDFDDDDPDDDLDI
ncbi:hypothetical protein BKA62DRAFT_772839 [Auriculariales sp. MPI-PUGE-AT-0066]|nr:hypothetical protein BKA62DRAFT_772839 [Auriculariales sp. MPI-PUGE-AT-0066]